MILLNFLNILNFTNLFFPKLLLLILIFGITTNSVVSDGEPNLEFINKTTNAISSEITEYTKNEEKENSEKKKNNKDASQNIVIQPFSLSASNGTGTTLINSSNVTETVKTSTNESLGSPTLMQNVINSNSSSLPNSAQSSNEVTNTSTTSIPAEPKLPDQGSAEDEHNSSMSIFFVLCVLALGILLIHLMLQTNFQYLPESVVIVFLGGVIGMIINLMSHQNIANWKKEEAFSPTAFFLVLLPPIIFESGYNLHKGNFFQNIGSIMVFAIFGTAISAFVIGGGVYLLGVAQVAYKLNFVESFAFGSLISAVDPVATVAIFHALDVDPVLNMLVFGESILNDAISIVLTTSVLESNSATTTSEAIIMCFNRFCLMFFASAGLGVVFALISALFLKHFDLRKNPSLEFGMMLVFTYAPYVLAEGIHLSGK